MTETPKRHKIKESKVNRELRFPEMDTYPTLAQYKQYIANNAFSQLDKINIKENDGKMTGI